MLVVRPDHDDVDVCVQVVRVRAWYRVREGPVVSDLTVRRKILVAAVVLGSGTARDVAVGDLIVECWRRWPESFALAGHPQHADSNRVLAKLVGPEGLVGLGWIARVATNTYRVRPAGLRVARKAAAELFEELRALQPPPPVVETPGPEPEDVPFEASAVRRAPRAASMPPPPPKARAEVSEAEAAELWRLARTEAARKWTRGQPITLPDACAFWGVTAADTGIPARLARVRDLLDRALVDDDDPRLPTFAVRFALRNTHVTLTLRFERQIETMARRSAEVAG